MRDMIVMAACQMASLSQKDCLVSEQLAHIHLDAQFLSTKYTVHHRHILCTYIRRGTQHKDPVLKRRDASTTPFRSVLTHRSRYAVDVTQGKGQCAYYADRTTYAVRCVFQYGTHSIEHCVVHPFEWQAGTSMGIVRRRIAAIASLKARVQEASCTCGCAIHHEAVPMLHGCVCV